MVKHSNPTNSDVARMEDYGVSPEWPTKIPPPHLPYGHLPAADKRRPTAPLLETIHLRKPEKTEAPRHLGARLKRRSGH